MFSPWTLALSSGPASGVYSPSSGWAVDQTASWAWASQIDCCTCRNAGEPGGLAPSTTVSTAPSRQEAQPGALGLGDLVGDGQVAGQGLLGLLAGQAAVGGVVVVHVRVAGQPLTQVGTLPAGGTPHPEHD
ncbi:hypothetical protein E1286_08090 [Nonomuraea terrae]|uniref:Uncharacterized protein n=1 Tax=Nonomuraea terrae TaxID=2530383 RepID=A0A4R4Z7A0_9ACTN|nr:hypothetical protein [Nonomuraea terrae]TDD53004.1 hypothetical protein E1286_08090 [Nonomuraea terrae]